MRSTCAFQMQLAFSRKPHALTSVGQEWSFVLARRPRWSLGLKEQQQELVRMAVFFLCCFGGIEEMERSSMLRLPNQVVFQRTACRAPERHPLESR